MLSKRVGGKSECMRSSKILRSRLYSRLLTHQEVHFERERECRAKTNLCLSLEIYSVQCFRFLCMILLLEFDYLKEFYVALLSASKIHLWRFDQEKNIFNVCKCS